MSKPREIKFKAYDKTGELQGPIEWDFILDDGFVGYYRDERFELCQFTGLLDKDGKEVYEGDVVKDSITRQSGYIKFGHPFCCGFIVRYTTSFNDRPLREDDTYWATLTHESLKCISVVGNIFEA